MKNLILYDGQKYANLLSKEMRFEDTFLTGSYSRSTMIAPLSDSDIDIFIVLNPMTYYLPGSKRYIFDEMLRILNNYYSETKNISKNGEAITICFSDFQRWGWVSYNKRKYNWRNTNKSEISCRIDD
jgi:hypothetical protein